MWRSKLFSFGGREILIKVVAQATSTYDINIFKIQLLRWEILCCAKNKGVLGFCDIRAFNKSPLAKFREALFGEERLSF